MTVGDGLDLLQQGNARGHLSLGMGGSPSSLIHKSVWTLGPENMQFAFDGDIDFGKVSATDLLGEDETPVPE